ncbi:MAG TPA: hypothetical protein VFU43_14020 [Streptosporangiaceae bacterium]|nr:hypothetical protein [Streptosporangiaceae bacterium]
MMESGHDDGTGLTQLVPMSLRRLAELDDALLERVVERLVAARGPADRLWQRGDVHQGERG